MLTKKEEDELFEILTEKRNILTPETCCMLRDFIKRADVPPFDYFKFCHTLKFIYGQTAEQSHRILEKIIKNAEALLDTMAQRQLSYSEKRGLFCSFSALGISASKISQTLKIPRNTASRWKHISGRSLIVSEGKKNARVRKSDSDTLEGRRYFMQKFPDIMKKAEAVILADSKKMTPANLGAYLKNCREGRGIIYSKRSLSKFISEYNNSKSPKKIIP